MIVLLIVFGAVFTFRVRWEQDITALLPKKDGSLATLAREWGMMKTVVVAVGPTTEGRTQAEILPALDRLTDALEKLPGVQSVTGRISADKARVTMMLLSAHAAALYRPERGKAIDADEVARRLEGLKARLAAPESMMIGEYLLSDPFGFSGQALRGMESAGAAMGAVVENGRLVSTDGRFGLVVANLDFDPMDIAKSGAFVGRLNDTLKNVSAKSAGVPILALGGVQYATATARGMMHDVSRAFLLTALAIVAVFLFFFRSLRMLPFALFPSGVGILFALGVMGLFGVPVHAVTMGFAAAICGISIDYVIHLLYRAGVGEADSRIAMSRALEQTLRPMTLGFLTTEGAFAIVAFSGFVGIRQLAIFSLISLPAAFFAAVFATPTLHRFLLRKAGKGVERRFLRAERISRFFNIGTRMNKRVVGFAFLLTFLLVAWGASSVSFSGDPRDLGFKDPVLTARENILRGAFPGLFKQAMIVSSGADLESALAQNDKLYEGLLAAGVAPSEIISISPFLPSKKTQQASFAAVRRVLGEESVRAAFSNAGFENDYVQSLRERTEKAAENPIEPEMFRNTVLSDLVVRSVHKDAAGSVHCLTRVRAADDAALEATAKLATTLGSLLVSERMETKNTLIQLQKEIVWMLALWLAAAVGAVAVVQRSVRFGVYAALPAVLGVAASAAVFALLGRPMTAVASAGITLVLGLSVDYGIFMLSREKGPETGGAVAASALTTLAGFGVLALSRTAAMSDIGLIILIGITAAAGCALLLVPSFQRLPGGTENRT